MANFRQLTDVIAASPQITPEDVKEAAQSGFTMIINNRPDGEEPGQPDSAAIEAAAERAGLNYAHIPIGHSGFGEVQIAAMTDALKSANGKVLAYCRSGTRSTFLWSLAQCHEGADPDVIARQAQGAGYDVSPVRPAMDMLAAKAKG